MVGTAWVPKKLVPPLVFLNIYQLFFFFDFRAKILMEDFLRFFILFFFLNDEFRIYNRVVDLNKYFSFFYSKTKKLLELLILRSHKYKLLYAHILLLLITRVFKNYNITIINFFLFKFNYTIINNKKKKKASFLLAEVEMCFLCH